MIFIKTVVNRLRDLGLVIWFIVQLHMQVVSVERSYAAMMVIRRTPLSSDAAEKAFLKQMLL